ncbi:uncharacterized protein LOC102801126 [Saccoglossus kowalevskii]|uniref:Uncharacterized protein LOC102801126 n=1 Tax=Saccoglossus kowalevskii TaxID=10224 RepID=A0ABM0MG45_SACKO|nr:PREDICTED: uncharacterized protein LOC102801126 [Saccoglossus kowalevskii]
MRRAFNILLCLCLTIAIWELYVMWGSLPEVLGSIKPVAGHGVVTNRSMGDMESPYRERTESSDARLNTTHRLTSLNDSNHGAGRVKTRSNFTAILNSNKNERNQSRSLKQHKSVQVNGQKNATNQPEYRKTTPSKAINKHEQSESGSKKTKTQQGKSISNKTITENDIRQNSSKIKMTEERNLTELKHAGGKELPNSDKNVVPPKESHIQKVTTPNLSEKTYLFPLHYDYNGPNVQYSSFRFGVAFALTYNRTVVENWFSTHWTTGAKQIRYVNETFDMAKLQEIVDVASVNEFKEACNSTVDALLMHPYHRMGGRTKAQYLERFLWKQKGLEKRYAITLPGPSHIPQSSEEAEALLLNPPKTKCLGVLDPSIDTKWLFPALTKHFDTVNTHIVSPPNIMKMVDEVEKKLCDGDPFVAMHWRNRSGEM